jgi:hypothetical protein
MFICSCNRSSTVTSPSIASGAVEAENNISSRSNQKQLAETQDAAYHTELSEEERRRAAHLTPNEAEPLAVPSVDVSTESLWPATYVNLLPDRQQLQNSDPPYSL